MCWMPRSTDGRSATAAASTAENPARTSGSVTSAPRSLDTPLITAECTEFASWNRHASPPRQAANVSISQPISFSAGTYTSRFSNTVSCSTDMPSAWVNSTISGCCQSVMKPGGVSVCTAAPAPPRVYHPGASEGDPREPVAGQPAGRAAQPRHALDDDPPVRAELDIRAHPLQEQRELDPLGFGGRVAEHR